MGARLALESSAARLVGRLSRAAGRGGGTTLPGKLVWKLDPGALDLLAGRLPQGVVLVSATNGKTTTTAIASSILGSAYRLAWNNSGANLASGVTSTLLAADGAELGLLEVDEFALPEMMRRTRPRAVCLGNLFRDQLDRYGELEHIAERWRDAVAELPPETTLVANADDPLVGTLAGGPRTRHPVRGRRPAACSPRAAARIRLEVLRPLRSPVPVRRRLRRAPRRVPLRNVRPRPAGARCRRPRDRARRPRRCLLRAARAVRQRPRPSRGARLYNVYNALAAASLALSLGIALDDVAAGIGRFSAAFGRFERFAVPDRSVLLVLIKNPAGANEAIRTLEDGGVPPTLVVALNDRIADGRDVSWIWDVDFEPLLERADRIVVSGERAAELALRFTYAGFPLERLELVAGLEDALDRGLELTPAGGELAVLPTYTAMLELRAIATTRGLTRPYWEDDDA